MTAANARVADHPIDPLFLNRWSPRAFSGEAMPQAELLTLLEAARWAPSSSNIQPWRFVYARRDTPHWERLFGLLNPFNQAWAQSASALVIVISKTSSTAPGSTEARPNRTHGFDAGAAWASLALQATLSGWQAHGMAGIHYDQAPDALGLPEGYEVHAAVAIGRPGDPATLPEALRARETPSTREPLGKLAFEGRFAE